MCSGSGGNESVPIVRRAAATMSVLSVGGHSSMSRDGVLIRMRREVASRHL